MRVLIRADASPTIGSGHIARCLTLARVFREQGAHVAFACRQLLGHRLQALASEGFETFSLPDFYPGEDPQQAIESLLPWQADIEALEQALADQPAFDWIIVDHYGLDHHWQTAVRRLAPRIMAVDDLATRIYSVDLLLNQNLSGTQTAYEGLLPEHCRTLLGPRYALLRDEFRCGAIDIKPKVKRVLVNFGGFDAAMQTHHAMLALTDYNELEVDFVAGADNSAWARMQRMAVSRPQWRLHRFVNDFHRLMMQADLFIGAGGGTSWERSAMGLPTICIAVSNNQQANSEVMATFGAHIYLGTREEVTVKQLRQAIGFVVDNQGLRQSLAQHSRRLVDGLGVSRVAVALAGALLQVRPATQADARLLFEGRNAEAVRRVSLDDSFIDWEPYCQWLQASLVNPQRLLLVGETSDGPVGVLRYDLQGSEAIVSIYLFGNRLGLGWGRALLTRGETFAIAHWPQLRSFTAQILPGNQASLELFSKSGFSQGIRVFTRILKDHLHE